MAKKLITTNDRYRGALLGLAIGDALGTTLEFTRPSDPFKPTVTDIVGGGPFNLRPGDWTDDTSMALCMAESLVEKQGFDAKDQMDRYWRWYDQGYNSVKGYCFDIGGTTSAALHLFHQTGRPFAGVVSGAGNGSLMRLAPAAMAARSLEECEQFCADSSRTTHGAIEAIDACRFYGLLIWLALNNFTKEVILTTPETARYCEKIREVAFGSYKTKMPPEISGSGYVVKSLEAALWAVYHGKTYQETVILAANLGQDTDTTACISGMLAGALYGVSNIPARWRNILTWREKFESLADQLQSMSERDD